MLLLKGYEVYLFDVKSNEQHDGENYRQEGAEVVADPGDGLSENYQHGAVADVKFWGPKKCRASPGETI